MWILMILKFKNYLASRTFPFSEIPEELGVK